jgi:putative hydroxymethylpyrimidine transport system permease protein
MKHKKKQENKFASISTHFLPIAGIVFVLLWWEIIVPLFAIPTWILPTPSIIAKRMITDQSLLLKNTFVTFLEASIGFSIAIVVSSLISLLLYLSKPLRHVFYPLLIGSQTIPIITIAPLFILWFGYDLLPKIVIVTLMCFFPICLSFLSGLLQVDPAKVELMKTFSAKPLQILWHCSIPSALPSFFSGLKIAATYCITAAVIGEWLGAKAGLGELMRRSMHSYSVDLTFAAIIIVSFLSICLLWLIQYVERKVLFWKEGSL